MVSNTELKMRNLAIKLFEINAFKFGDFKMKVGINSPVYFDLRVIVSHPEVMNTVADLLTEYIQTKNMIECDHLCGVPYTALPVATLISVKAMKPMLIRRKEAKAYGTKKLIEGQYNAGDSCLIIEDVVTSGLSILETVNDLRSEGIRTTDAIVLVNREQGGEANLTGHNVKMHSLYTLSYLLNVLQEAGKIEASTVASVAKYIAGCQIKSDGSFVDSSTKIVNELSRTKMTFEARAKLAKSPMAKQLFQTMVIKKSNLCLAVDLTKTEDILNLVEKVGPYICVLKTHVDIIEDFSDSFIGSLKALAKKHKFLIMEDRKFADIGNTVSLQYANGIYKISSWADFVTVHSLPGQSIVQGLKAVLEGDCSTRGIFLLAELSSHGNLINAQYTAATAKLATEGNDCDLISGIVCQNGDVVASPGLIQLTPGVQLEEGGDELGQQYNTPEHVVGEKGADLCVVGRGILRSKNPQETAKVYRDRLWQAYCDRISNK